MSLKTETNKTKTAANDDAPKLNRRQLSKARTTQKVLDGARALFFSVGYEAATIREIAEDIGMSTGAVFASYKGKAELYRAVYGHDPLTPEQGLELAEALREAEAFMSGFEGDELQDGIDARLWRIRSALGLIDPKQAAQSSREPAVRVSLKEAA